MKNKLIKSSMTAAMLLSYFILHPSPMFGQGSLTPPGPPAPTMMTLAQIEPRTPISSSYFSITTPGSYYLTTNLSVGIGNAIFISTNQVTLDLNGFTISSTDDANLGSGILLTEPTSTDITILNGHITGGVTDNGSGGFSGPGFICGIECNGTAYNVRVSGLSVSGCLGGILFENGYSMLVDSCTVHTVGGNGIIGETVSHCSICDCGGVGIYAINVSHCTALDCGDYGIDAQIVSDCYGAGVTVGIAALYTANNCEGSSTTGIGIRTQVANNCQAQSNSGIGLSTWMATGCFATSVSGQGIIANMANFCFSSSGDSSISHTYNMP